MNNEILLNVKNISRSIKPRLENLSFSLSSGEALALVGHNGAGKTSLLKCILGVLDCKGLIEIQGTNIAKLSRKELSRKIAYVPQQQDVDCLLSVEQYLDLSFFSQPVKSEKRKQDAISIFKLSALLSQSFSTLSGGERQRVLVACAYCQNPKIYLLDEPFSMLDLANTKDILEIISMLKVSGSGVVIALHDLNLVSYCAEKVLQVANGEILTVESYLDNCSNITFSQAAM